MFEKINSLLNPQLYGGYPKCNRYSRNPTHVFLFSFYYNIGVCGLKLMTFCSQLGVLTCWYSDMKPLLTSIYFNSVRWRRRSSRGQDEDEIKDTKIWVVTINGMTLSNYMFLWKKLGGLWLVEGQSNRPTHPTNQPANTMHIVCQLPHIFMHPKSDPHLNSDIHYPQIIHHIHHISFENISQLVRALNDSCC